jgi:hypothetical protein
MVDTDLVLVVELTKTRWYLVAKSEGRGTSQYKEGE